MFIINIIFKLLLHFPLPEREAQASSTSLLEPKYPRVGTLCYFYVTTYCLVWSPDAYVRGTCRTTAPPQVIHSQPQVLFQGFLFLPPLTLLQACMVTLYSPCANGCAGWAPTGTLDTNGTAEASQWAQTMTEIVGRGSLVIIQERSRDLWIKKLPPHLAPEGLNNIPCPCSPFLLHFTNLSSISLFYLHFSLQKPFFMSSLKSL